MYFNFGFSDLEDLPCVIGCAQGHWHGDSEMTDSSQQSLDIN